MPAGSIKRVYKSKKQAVRQLASALKSSKKPTVKEEVRKIKKELRRIKPELKHHQNHVNVSRTVVQTADVAGTTGCYFTVADGLFDIDEGIDDATRVGESLSTASAVVDLKISPRPTQVGSAYGQYDTERRLRIIALQIRQGPYPTTQQLLPYISSDGTYLSSIFDPDLKRASGFKVLHDKIYTYQKFMHKSLATGAYDGTDAVPAPYRIRLRLKPKMKLQWDGALGSDLLNPVFIYVIGDYTDTVDANLRPDVRLISVQHWFRDN